ncbi:hypothetical protein POJ06DRAFT_196055 [Lipomyces tetrasporus]|uniref:Uncharacterized protein n=1 Tax=Lipomyces tetrasporus TaxID=54092 RepID=A0AAD7QU51_9ASCO|nr:uncharacterized protein POJ06DRAFT_196055 [Lipomyces tetrasporus]KAJ8101414.1 hypothetical protein POJ06DRAFT_196055 [Lipomyces tetrasporus]
MRLDHIAEKVLIALGRHPTKEPLNHSFIPLGVAGFITKRMNLKRLPERMDWDSYDPPAKSNLQQLQREAGGNDNSREVVEIPSSPESPNRQSKHKAENVVQTKGDEYDVEPMEGVESEGIAEKFKESLQGTEVVANAQTVEPEPIDIDAPTEILETSATQVVDSSVKIQDGQVVQPREEEDQQGVEEEEEEEYVSGFTALNKLPPQPSTSHSLSASSESSARPPSTFERIQEPAQSSRAESPVVSDIGHSHSLGPAPPQALTVKPTETASSSSMSVLTVTSTTQKTLSDKSESLTSTKRVLDTAQAPLAKRPALSDDTIDVAPSVSPAMAVEHGQTSAIRPTAFATVVSQSGHSMTSTSSARPSPIATPARLAMTNERRRRPVNRFVTSSEPHYNVYNCRWPCIRAGKQDICAQMHNIDALWTHVTKKHRDGSAAHGYKCLWEKCQNENKLNYRFDSLRECHKHILENHIRPIEDELGPGPSVKGELEKWPDTLARTTSSLLTPLAIPMSEERAAARTKQLAQETPSVPAKLPRQLLEAINDLKTYGAGWSPEEDGQVDTESPSRQDGEADDDANKPRGNLGLYYSYEL